jgi:ATP-dependent DNA helicase RecQ
MHGKRPVEGRLREEADVFTRTTEEAADYDRDLFGELRVLRKELADGLDLPPYAVFPDKTLIEMATFLPQTEERLLQLHGVGRVKLDRYGRDFLDHIREYCALHGLDKPVVFPSDNTKRLAPGRNKRPRHLEVADKFNQGKSIAFLMAEYQVKQTTIVNHLYKALVQGYPLDVEGAPPFPPHLSEAHKVAVFNTFDRFGTERMGPIFRAMNEEISYDDLFVLRLHYLFKKASGFD